MTPADYIDRHANRLLETLRRLVRFETVNPPGADYDAITRHLVSELEARGLSARRLSPAKTLQKRFVPDCADYPRYNVLGRWKVPGARRTIHFNAHYDVVPVSGDWKHKDPFSGTVDKGHIYGRGTADMKGSIAALLLALEALKTAGTSPRLNVEISFTADEETDSALGTGWLVTHAPISPDYALVMEGGEKDNICCGHNGVVWLEVDVLGRAAHGSRPEQGINALEKMAALVGSLERYKIELLRKSFRSPDGAVLRPTINVGGVFEQGPGGKINTVPAFARFSIDRRVIPSETAAKAEEGLRRFIEASARRIPDCRVRIRKVCESHPCYSKPESPFFGAVAKSISLVRGEAPKFSVSTGFTDMQFFSFAKKIPTLGYGPGGLNEHGVDERVAVRELLASAKVYADLLASFEG